MRMTRPPYLVLVKSVSSLPKFHHPITFFRGDEIIKCYHPRGKFLILFQTDFCCRRCAGLRMNVYRILRHVVAQKQTQFRRFICCISRRGRYNPLKHLVQIAGLKGWFCILQWRASFRHTTNDGGRENNSHLVDNPKCQQVTERDWPLKGRNSICLLTRSNDSSGTPGHS